MNVKDQFIGPAVCSAATGFQPGARCLVTGGAGFIGSHLVERLLTHGVEVRVLDNLETGKRENLDSVPAELIIGDLRDRRSVWRAVRDVQYVFHLGALGSVPRSVRDPFTTHEVNATGTLYLLQACVDAGVQRVVMASSSSVYGNSVVQPTHENSPPAPESPYAVTKLMGEHYCRMFSHLHGLETACLRYFNVFGPRQPPDSQYAAVIPRFIHAALCGENPVIFGDGRQTRDFTYVDNTVEATILAATVPGTAGLTANVACGERRSLLDLVQGLSGILGRKITPEFAEPRAGDIRHSQASTRRAEQQLGYRPSVSFEEGLSRTVTWHLGTIEERTLPASSAA